MRNTDPENVAEHTFEVAIVAHALAILHNAMHTEDPVDEADVVLSALYHETAEAITGDLPTPIKHYNQEIAGAYKAIERQAEQSMLQMLPEDLRKGISPYVTGDVPDNVRRIVKAADKICAYIKCVEEKKSGNGEFDYAADRILEAIDQMDMPEVAYFIGHFMDAYGMTLDELNGR